MRTYCIKKRNPIPDKFFIEMVRNSQYTWMNENEDDREWDSETDAEDWWQDAYKEDEFDDDYSKRFRRAGFHMDEDGEFEYDDENTEDQDDEMELEDDIK